MIRKTYAEATKPGEPLGAGRMVEGHTLAPWCWCRPSRVIANCTEVWIHSPSERSGATEEQLIALQKWAADTQETKPDDHD